MDLSEMTVITDERMDGGTVRESSNLWRFFLRKNEGKVDKIKVWNS